MCKALKHPNYLAEFYYWDIGLLLLTRNIKTSKRVQIAKIAPFSKWRNVKNTMTIAGFGSTDVSLQHCYNDFKFIIIKRVVRGMSERTKYKRHTQ